MFHHVDTGDVIEAIHADGAARHVVSDIVNGVNTWLFRVLSEYRVDQNEAKRQCLRFGKKITAHLKNIYELERRYAPSKKSFREYLECESQAVSYGLDYITRSFRSSFRESQADYAASLVALLICARRAEQIFEDYRKGLPQVEVREALLSYYTLNKSLLVNRKGGAQDPEKASEKATSLDDRLAFRGFNP